DYLLIDAMQLDVLIEQKSLIKGDARSVSIAAASILAKTHRDSRLEELDSAYPGYGLAQHKGYSTHEHMEALRRLGPTPLHRYSFAPVRESQCWPSGATHPPLPLGAYPFPPLRPSFAFVFLFTTGIPACLQSLAPSLTPPPPACSVNKVCWPLLAA